MLWARFQGTFKGQAAQMLGETEWMAVTLSVQVSLWATAISLPVAIGVAYLLARHEFRGHAVLNALVHAPLVLPPVVTGYLLLLLFSRNGPAGQVLLDWFGVTLAFHWTGAVLAAAIMAFPLMVRAIRLGFEAVDPKLEQAAQTLGVRPVVVFATITLPLIFPSVLAGMVLAFAKAMGEFGATITFVSNIPGQTQTIPSAIYSAMQVPGQEPVAMTLVLISAAIAVGALIVSEILARRMQRRLAA